MDDSSSDEVSKTLEWAAREIAPDLRRLLKARYRLVADHDDLVQQTLLDLRDYIGRNDQKEPVDLRRIAFTILKRRLIDRFRGDAKAAADAVAGRAPEPLAPSTETVVSDRQLLFAVLGFIAEMAPQDRDLLLDEASGTERAGPMPPAMRQRLSRLRAQLRDFLQAKGVSASELREGNDG